MKKDKDIKRIYRSGEERVLAGVCGGIAEYLKIDPVLVRLGFILLALLNGIGIALYILGWILIPEKGKKAISSNINISHKRSKGYPKLLVGAAVIMLLVILVNSHVFTGIFVVLAVLAILFILRKMWKFLAFVVALLAILAVLAAVFLGGMYFAGSYAIARESRDIVQELPLEPNITTVELNIEYGAGEIRLSEDGSGMLFRNEITTSDLKDPGIDYRKHGTEAIIDVSRSNVNDPMFWKRKSDRWDMKLSPELIYDIDLDFGAASVRLDLSKLKVDQLDLDFGAANTEIIFSSHPTKAEINAGASSIDLRFPKNMSIVIDAEGGVLTKNFEGFIKKDEKYYSENYESYDKAIKVTISAGVTNINAGFY